MGPDQLQTGADMTDSIPPGATPAAAKKATWVDITLSLLLPGCGVVFGVIVLIKGERKRATTMIVIGALVLAVCVGLWWSDMHSP